MESPDDKKKPESHPLANLSPEQLRTVLSSDLKGGRPLDATKSGGPSWRRILWAGLILLAGLAYVVMRFSTAPSKVIIVNTSGDDAASVVVVSGDQRRDFGGLANGEIRQVELIPGKPLHIDYTFDERRGWTDSEPLAAFHSVTIFIGIDKKLRVVREAPWSHSEPPAVQPAAR